METNQDQRRTPWTKARFFAAALPLSLLLPLLLPQLLHPSVFHVRAQTQALWSYDSKVDNPKSVNTNFGKSSCASPDGNWLVIGAHTDTVNDLSEAGSATIFMRNSGAWVSSTTLTAATPVTGAKFGYALVMSEDRLVVGAPFGSPGQGELTPYTRSGSTWTKQAELSGPAGSELGSSLDTDGTFLVAGGMNYSGAKGVVVVFTVDGGGLWAALITLAGTANSGRLGGTVSLGSSFIASGAASELNFLGATYVWTISNGAVGSTATRLTSSTALPSNSFFGSTLAVTSSTTVAVGCSSSNPVVYFFTLSAGTWSQFSILAAPPGVSSFPSKLSFSSGRLLIGTYGKALLYPVTDGIVSSSSSYIDLVPTGVSVSNSYGGSSVVLSGLNAFACESIMFSYPLVQRLFSFRGIIPTQSQSVSPIIHSVVPHKKSKSKALGYKVAFWDDNAIISVPFCFDSSKSCDGGYILLFQKNSESNEWVFNTKVRNPFRNRENKFGYNIYVRDNYLFVSVPNSQYVDKNAGVIVVYKWNPATNTYEKESIIRYRKTDKTYALGAAISSFGSITTIGMPEYDASSTLQKSGGVHAYKKKDSGKWRGRKTITAPTPKADEFFGQSVSLQSETRIAISNNPSDVALQAVYVFDFDSDNDVWACVQTLTDIAKAGFGWSIKFFDDLLYISAASNAGSISVYEADAQAMYAVSYTFQPVTAISDERFGFSFDTDGTRLVVGTKPCDDGVGCGTKGSAYTFTKNSDNHWTQQYRYAVGAADGSDGFGSDVAVSGDTILVAAPFKAISTRDGVAYFIRK